jgi:hypothetical protein
VSHCKMAQCFSNMEIIRCHYLIMSKEACRCDGVCSVSSSGGLRREGKTANFTEPTSSGPVLLGFWSNFSNILSLQIKLQLIRC